MAVIVKVRACIFIPMAWLRVSEDPETGVLEYEGDDREFTPHTGNTLRFRVEQEVTVDFSKRAVFAHANTGISRERKRGPDGRLYYREAKCDTRGIVVDHVTWDEHRVAMNLRVSAANPLIENAATVDYVVHTVVHADGHVQLKGAHDGFPCFEFYKQVDFGDFEVLYTYDHRKAGTGPTALAGPMDRMIDRTL